VGIFQKQTMTDTTVPEPDGSEEAVESSRLQVALGFFVLPLLLVVGAIAVFLLFGVIAHEDKPPSEYLAEVTGGGINEPWQAAFHLAQMLAVDDSLRGDEDTARAIARALEHRNAQDAQVRQFLVLALGSVGHPSSVAVLAPYLDDASPDVRLNALMALGGIGAPAASAAAPSVAAVLDDEDVGIRTYAAYLLGVLEDQSVTGRLAVALNDPAFPVRGNAAVALARLGDDAGLDELRKMIDRAYIGSQADMSPQQQQDAMIAAIQALGLLNATDAEEQLQNLNDNDPDLRVRETARLVLAEMHDRG
jgi:HEAT repeat protein